MVTPQQAIFYSVFILCSWLQSIYIEEKLCGCLRFLWLWLLIAIMKRKVRRTMRTAIIRTSLNYSVTLTGTYLLKVSTSYFKQKLFHKLFHYSAVPRVFLGHTGTCTGTGTLTNVLESASSGRQTDKSYGSI